MNNDNIKNLEQIKTGLIDINSNKIEVLENYYIDAPARLLNANPRDILMYIKDSGEDLFETLNQKIKSNGFEEIRTLKVKDPLFIDELVLDDNNCTYILYEKDDIEVVVEIPIDEFKDEVHIWFKNNNINTIKNILNE